MSLVDLKRSYLAKTLANLTISFSCGGAACHVKVSSFPLHFPLPMYRYNNLLVKLWLLAPDGLGSGLSMSYD